MGLSHSGESLHHQPFHDPVAGVLRVGAHTCDKSHRIAHAEYVHVKRVYRELRYQAFPVKASQHIRSLKHRELRLFDLVVLPACLLKLLLRHLERIAQKRVILFHIRNGQFPDRKIVFFLFSDHRSDTSILTLYAVQLQYLPAYQSLPLSPHPQSSLPRRTHISPADKLR